jgi:hypothetical protein
MNSTTPREEKKQEIRRTTTFARAKPGSRMSMGTSSQKGFGAPAPVLDQKNNRRNMGVLKPT